MAVILKDIKSKFINYLLKRDPYLRTLSVALMTVLAVLINGAIYIYIQPDDFFLPLLFGGFLVMLCNIPFYSGKKDKYKAIFLMLFLAIFAFSGSILVSGHLLIIVIYFFCLAFILYLFTLKNILYRLHVSLILTLAIIYTHLSKGTIFEVKVLLMNCLLSTLIAFILTVLYPENYILQARLGIRRILLGIHNLSKENDIVICKEKFFELSEHTLAVSCVVEKIKKSQQKQFEKSFRLLRHVMLSMHMVYVKHKNDQSIKLMNQLIQRKLIAKETRDLLKEAENCSSMIKGALIKLDENFDQFYICYGKINKENRHG